MKKYKNIEKYFKTTAGGAGAVVMIFKFILTMNFLGTVATAVIALLFAPLKFVAIAPLLGGLVLLIPLTILNAYGKNIMNSMLAKKLMYGASRDIVIGYFDQMNEELEHPAYADIDEKDKKKNFAITGSWIIGTSAPVVPGLEAVKVSEVKEADREDLLIRKGVREVTLYAIQITDSKKEAHVFVFRDERKREDALYQIRVISHIG